MTISFAIIIIFLTKEKFFQSEIETQRYQYNYLSNKLSILKRINNKKNNCNVIEKFKSIIEVKEQKYSFYCVKRSLFIGKKPTKEKYIHFTKLSDVLNISNTDVIEIEHLKDLPDSSEQNPQVVLIKNHIDETLRKDFYGIIITTHYFDIKGNAKIYGILYSSYPNNREERNITFRNDVILNLENKYAYWEEMSSSRNMLNNE